MTVEELHETYAESLHRYARKLVADSDLADDLVQETFIRQLGHLPLLAQLAQHQRRAWLYQTLKHLYLDRRAARLRETALKERLTLEVETHAAADESAGFDAFELVPPGDRELVEKRYRLGLSSSEIAAELGIPAATVRSRLHQIVTRLRQRREKFLN